MKIIAKTANNSFLLDCTSEEIAQIQGLCTVDSRYKYPEMGDEIKIHEAYHLLKSSLYPGDLEAMKRSIAEAQKALDMFTMWKSKVKEIAGEFQYQPKR